MSFICPIHSSAEDVGYISDILFETNEIVKAGSAIFIIDAQKQKMLKKNGRLKLIQVQLLIGKVIINYMIKLYLL